MNTMNWKPARAEEIEAAATLGNRIHVGYPEDPEVFARRFELYPSGFMVLPGTADELAGYAIFHPWSIGAPPRLNEYIERLPQQPDCMHLHDIAIDDAWRGRNHTGQLLSILEGRCVALNLKAVTLVAVKGTERLWERFGFRDARMPSASEACLSYSENAHYMVRTAQSD